MTVLGDGVFKEISKLKLGLGGGGGVGWGEVLIQYDLRFIRRGD